MPIKVKQSMPARDILESENIFVMTENRAITQDIRPLKVLVLNLMPTKIVTETQILRKLSNTPLQIEVEFMQTATYQSQHTDKNHLDEFYKTFDQIKDKYYDGFIITGAPLDFVDYKDVDYWDEGRREGKPCRHRERDGGFSGQARVEGRADPRL